MCPVPDHSYFENLIWQIADLLRGPYRPPQYERVMLPMTVLRRFDCVLAPTKDKVLAEHAKRKGSKLNDDALDRLLDRAAKQRFHNHSPLDFAKLKGDPDHIEKHLVSYIKGFSANVRRIFEFFEFEGEIEKMRDSNILFLVVSKQMLEGLFMERMDQNEDIFVRYMNDKGFQRAVTQWMASEAYRKLRDENQQTDDASVPPEPVVLPFRPLSGEEAKPYENCVPLLDLRVAAGGFSPTQEVNDSEQKWVALTGRVRPAKDVFVAQVVGESMNRRIPHGSWCVWRLHPAGSRQGKVVLAQHRDIQDPEYGGTYTVKVYGSEKEADGDGGWRHSRIVLKPDSTDASFTSIVLEDLDEGELTIIAEMIEVLG